MSDDIIKVLAMTRRPRTCQTDLSGEIPAAAVDAAMAVPPDCDQEPRLAGALAAALRAVPQTDGPSMEGSWDVASDEEVNLFREALIASVDDRIAALTRVLDAPEDDPAEMAAARAALARSKAYPKLEEWRPFEEVSTRETYRSVLGGGVLPSEEACVLALYRDLLNGGEPGETDCSTSTGEDSTSNGEDSTASPEDSTATGEDTVATGKDSTSNGEDSTASPEDSTSNGKDTVATGKDSTSNGEDTVATGKDSTSNGEDTVATGEDTVATGKDSTSNGEDSTASPEDSTSNGKDTVATGKDSTSNGEDTVATGKDSTSNGEDSTSTGEDSTASPEDSTSNGEDSTASPEDSTSNGEDSTASPEDSTSNGEDSTASPEDSTSNGEDTVATGKDSTSNGEDSTASPEDSTSNGKDTVATGKDSTSNGEDTVATGKDSTSNGEDTVATGKDSTSNGEDSTSTGEDSTASPEDSTSNGEDSTASPEDSTSNGEDSTASPEDSTSNGEDSTASPEDSTSNGEDTVATGKDSTSNGEDTVATGEDTVATGKDSTSNGEDSTASPEDSTSNGEDSTASPEDSTSNGEDSTASPEDSTSNGEDTVDKEYLRHELKMQKMYKRFSDERYPGRVSDEFVNRERPSGQPSKALVKKLSEMPIYLVEKRYKFRKSFSRLESEVIRSMTKPQRICLVLLKHCAVVTKSALCSYDLKTAMMWVCEERAPELWTWDGMLESMRAVLDFLRECVEWGALPCYFNPKINLCEEDGVYIKGVAVLKLQVLLPRAIQLLLAGLLSSSQAPLMRHLLNLPLDAQQMLWCCWKRRVDDPYPTGPDDEGKINPRDLCCGLYPAAVEGRLWSERFLDTFRWESLPARCREPDWFAEHGRDTDSEGKDEEEKVKECEGEEEDREGGKEEIVACSKMSRIRNVLGRALRCLRVCGQCSNRNVNSTNLGGRDSPVSNRDAQINLSFIIPDSETTRL
ncbi:S-antigen protein [Amphibalanus amphitrite]|uniref:S-antigen protein n=1 Tax=Amphibalanus amphitrite TaxID=1232801 RepID=A0A6A4VA67_AMPAM|nr:S-antigen protein [Amphibalanus amphitrite]